MNFTLSEEQELLVSTVREFCEKELYPHEEMVERSGTVPDELAQQIKQKCIDIGFYASNMPEEVGGGGLSHLDFCLLERELGRASMALNHFFGRHSNLSLIHI